MCDTSPAALRDTITQELLDIGRLFHRFTLENKFKFVCRAMPDVCMSGLELLLLSLGRVTEGAGVLGDEHVLCDHAVRL